MKHVLPLLVLAFCVITPVVAQFPPAIPVVTAPGIQSEPSVIPDGLGGTIVVWADNRSGQRAIYGQRFTAAGTPLWAGNGALVWEDPGLPASDTKHAITADGIGGVFVAMTVVSPKICGTIRHEVFAQHLDSSGSRQWTPAGVQVGFDTSTTCTNAYVYHAPGVIGDDAGGIFISWSLNNDDSTSLNTRVQRLDPAGTPLWAPNGVEIHTPGEEFGSRLVKDGAGGAMIVCQAWDVTPFLKIQRISGSGDLLWPSGWVALDSAALNLASVYVSFDVASDDAGGVIIGMYGYGSLQRGMHAVRIDSAGTILWDTYCDDAPSTLPSYNSPRIARDGHGGAFVSWMFSEFGPTVVKAQHLSSAGAPQWASGGVAVSSVGDVQPDNPGVAPDGSGGALIVWAVVGALKIEQVDSLGVLMFDNALTITDTSTIHEMATSGDGHGLIVWSRDANGSGPDLYATRFADLGLIQGIRTSWRLVSVPRVVPDWSKTAIFPAGVSDAFAFLSTAYLHVDTLQLGAGYWIKFPGGPHDPVPSNSAGDPVAADTIGLGAGWSMIGSLTDPFPVGAITSDPAGIINSNFFEYDGAYAVAESIKPMQGYWVKLSQAGSLILASAAAEGKHLSVTNALEGFSEITITDASGHAQTLYFGGDDSPRLKEFSLPPPPPVGSFDVRFSSGMMAEPRPATGVKELTLQIVGAAYPLTIRWRSAGGPSGATLIAEGRSVSLGEQGETRLGSRSTVSLRLTAAASALPALFRLEANYPNPFNPSTTIRYEIPRESKVSLKVYDLLGQVVAVLVNDVVETGYRSVVWDAGNMPSGVYFYRLQAGGFVETRKLVLMR